MNSENASLLEYVQLTKPRLTLTVLATVLLGFVMGSDGNENGWLLLKTLFASFWVGAGANALNQLYEKDVDAKMKRTEGRPLPAGRLNEKSALIFGLASAASGTLFLCFLVNPLTALMALLTVLSYVLVYTPLKRLTPLNTFVGAVPGALPTLMGWAASAGTLDPRALILFAILYVWQIPHFFAISWIYREDYLRSGLRMLILEDPAGSKLSVQIVFFAALLLFVALTPYPAKLAGGIYLGAAFIASALFFAFAVRWTKNRKHAGKTFVTVSILHLLVLIAFMIADKI